MKLNVYCEMAYEHSANMWWSHAHGEAKHTGQSGLWTLGYACGGATLERVLAVKCWALTCLPAELYKTQRVKPKGWVGTCRSVSIRYAYIYSEGHNSEQWLSAHTNGAKQCLDKISEQYLITKAHSETQEWHGLKCESKIWQSSAQVSLVIKHWALSLTYQAELNGTKPLLNLRENKLGGCSIKP